MDMTFLTSSLLVDFLSVTTAIVIVGYAYFWWSFQYWKKRNVPYLEPVIPWGNLEKPHKRTMYMGDNIRVIYEEAKTRGWKYCGMYTMARPTYLVLDLDLVKQIMTKDFHNFTDRGFYVNEKDDPLSCHLFAIGGVKWRNLRTKLSPTFTSGKMKSMFNTLVECGSALEKYVEQHADNKEGVDIKDIMGNFSTDIIGSCAFGLDCNSFKDPNSPFRLYGKKIFIRTFVENIKLAFCIAFPGIAGMFRLCLTPKDIAEFFMKVIEDTVSYRDKNNVRRNDFLQLLIDIKNNKGDQDDKYRGDGKTLTMDEVAAQSFVFFLAGFETSSTTMTFALYELATHQDIQDKVREEINRIFAKYDGETTYDSINDLKYLGQVIDETLRIYSPLPFVTRQSAANYKILGADVILEKGTRVMIPIRAIHFDSQYYENPTEFDPDRFTEKNKAKRHPYAHIPFGEGPRICIGERFGLMQSKVGLTTILRKFKVTLNEKTRIPFEYSKTSFFPTVEGGIWLNLEKL